MRLSSAQRRCYVAFLLHAFTELRFKPQSMTKYCAVLFFHRRYLPYLESQPRGFPRETDVQFNCLLCLWIASKLHETPPISIRKLQNLAKRTITDHYYTRRDFISAEVKFMKDIGYNLTTGPLVSTYIEELLAKFSQKSTEVGTNVSLKLCLAILDLLYVCKDEIVKKTPIELAGASILVAAYALAMPTDKCVFPMLTSLELETDISIGKLRRCARKILRCIATGIDSANRAIIVLEHIK
ncbi:hypothetical protein M758_1G128400 [Ceratodon purpureus]|uniref:Cyclin N-terminal domain-containing protein n=1 Tax=Ceratodon purpureus TaxID=3225 RepID=A0A8T0J4Q3_CERPU|nr:hypothetical protein KC19_1G133200 [Ceratodon purpureus]KAG0629764.1 hypothetical protein M758_1G128400 [Ceratodon purpureus]